LDGGFWAAISGVKEEGTVGVVGLRGGNLLNGLLGGKREDVVFKEAKLLLEKYAGLESVVVVSVVVGLMELKMLLERDPVFAGLGISKVEENRNVEVCGVVVGALIPPNSPPVLPLVVVVVVPPFTPFYKLASWVE